MSGRIWELLVILLLVLVLFGAGKLPVVMAQIGRGIRLLRGELDGFNETDQNNTKKSQDKEEHNKN